MKKHIIFMLGITITFIISCFLFLFSDLSVQSKPDSLEEQVYTTSINENNQNNILNDNPVSIKDEKDFPETVIIEDSNEYENRWDITLTDEEIELLARIVMLEAGGESDMGKDAVVEVIFNRMYDEDFPDTLYGVLSEEGQFAVWKNRNSASAVPTEEVYESIHYVLTGQTDILPFKTVYFSRGGQPGKKEQITIDNHVFCNK